MQVTLIGVDLAKTIFQLCGVNQAGRPVMDKQVKRTKLLAQLAHYRGAVIAMEACPGSNYWGRELEKRGYKVKLIPPQHVKPFVKGNKNDRNDAFAITEAARRPNLVCVKPRTLAQTDLIQVHRVRSLLVDQRSDLIRQLRGLLSEYGVVVNRGKDMLLSALPAILDEAENGLTPAATELFAVSQAQWCHLNGLIKEFDRQIKHQARASEPARRLVKIKGVAAQTATAVIAHAGNGQSYKNGRHFAATLGLVPKEHSSGGKQKLGGITKRGNNYLRRLLIQGAWSVIRYADRSDDRLSRWATRLIERRGKHKAAVAVANKLARVIWSMLYHQTEYRAA